jgi:hypothetical protein
VVLRLFDGEFADRVQRAFSIDISRSVSYLAAPAFAAAMLGRHVIATIPVRRRVLLVAEVPVGPDSPAEHQTVSSINRDHEVRLLAIRTGKDTQVLWRPSEGRPLRRTDVLVVVASRAGLSRLLADTSTPIEAAEATPFRLLQPWEMPQPRPTTVESPQPSGYHPNVPGVPPLSPEVPAPRGPADAGSTRTA